MHARPRSAGVERRRSLKLKANRLVLWTFADRPNQLSNSHIPINGILNPRRAIERGLGKLKSGYEGSVCLPSNFDAGQRCQNPNAAFKAKVVFAATAL